MATYRPKIGDVLEIRFPEGVGYLQYTHNHRMMGTLVRVLRLRAARNRSAVGALRTDE